MLTIADRANHARESRQFNMQELEVRTDDETGGYTFDGIASVVGFGYTVRDMFGEFTETIEPGAFNRTLKQRDDVRLLVNHEGVPLARTKSKTLDLTTTPHLRAVAQLDPLNPRVQEIGSAMKRGDLDQMSIGFRVKDGEWSDDYTERTIREVQLFDVSVVTYPASPTTTASLRNISDLLAMFPEGGDYDEDEIRRAVAHLEKLLPAADVADVAAEFAQRDREDRERLDRKIADRPAYALV